MQVSLYYNYRYNRYNIIDIVYSSGGACSLINARAKKRDNTVSMGMKRLNIVNPFCHHWFIKWNHMPKPIARPIRVPTHVSLVTSPEVSRTTHSPCLLYFQHNYM